MATVTGGLMTPATAFSFFAAVGINGEYPVVESGGVILDLDLTGGLVISEASAQGSGSNQFWG